MENQDKIIQDLIDHLIKQNSITSKEYRIEKNISDSDWSQIKKIALERDYMVPGGSEDSYFITQKGKGYGDGSYIEEIQKEKAENELRKQKEVKEAEKFETDLIIARWQKRTYWWVFGLGGIGGICGIISLCLQLTARPVIEKEYIRVDSHGKTYGTHRNN